MKIAQTAYEFIQGASRNAYPREFIGMLRAEKGTITEVLVIPGSEFETSSSTVYMNMVPMDPTIVGSVHSHPGAANPSQADLRFFQSHGRIHIIVSSRGELVAYNNHGERTTLEIVK